MRDFHHIAHTAPDKVISFLFSAMDKIVRRMAFGKYLVQEEKVLTREARRYLQSYADGVNAFIATHARPWPFFLVGYQPTDWQVALT